MCPNKSAAPHILLCDCKPAQAAARRSHSSDHSPRAQGAALAIRGPPPFPAAASLPERAAALSRTLPTTLEQRPHCAPRAPRACSRRQGPTPGPGWTAPPRAAAGQPRQRRCGSFGPVVDAGGRGGLTGVGTGDLTYLLPPTAPSHPSIPPNQSGCKDCFLDPSRLPTQHCTHPSQEQAAGSDPHLARRQAALAARQHVQAAVAVRLAFLRLGATLRQGRLCSVWARGWGTWGVWSCLAGSQLGLQSICSALHARCFCRHLHAASALSPPHTHSLLDSAHPRWCLPGQPPPPSPSARWSSAPCRTASSR